MERKIFFDQAAPRWNHHCHTNEQTLAIENGLNLLGSIDGKKVIDVGCGTGVLTRQILPRLGQGKLLGLDFSNGMIEAARKVHLDARIEWRCCDVLHANLERSSADVVLCFNAFPHFSDQQKALMEFSRWLSEGGQLLIWHDIGRERLAEIHRRLGPPMDQDLLLPISEMSALCEQAGFKIHVAREDQTSYILLARKTSV